MATFKVTVPTSKAKKTTDNRGVVVGVPDFGVVTPTEMTKEEFEAWFNMFLADSTMGSTFYVERHGS